MSHWSYTSIIDKLKDKCELQGVLVKQVSPVYTSQRCSQCGRVRKGNRDGREFKCKSCSYECDADLNASNNIVLNLPPIGRQKRLSRDNRNGFYWNEISKESIVPCVQEANSYFSI